MGQNPVAILIIHNQTTCFFKIDTADPGDGEVPALLGHPLH